MNSLSPTKRRPSQTNTSSGTPRRSSVVRIEEMEKKTDNIRGLELNDEEKDSRPPWLTLIDREIGSIPDPILILRKEIGDLNFDMTTLGLDIKGQLKDELTSYLLIEEKPSSVAKDFHQLPWTFVCESSILIKESYPYYTAEPYKRLLIRFRTKDTLIRISVMAIGKNERRLSIGSTTFSISELISCYSPDTVSIRKQAKNIFSRELLSNGIKVGDLEISTFLHHGGFTETFTPENKALQAEIEVIGKSPYLDVISSQRSYEYLYFQQPPWMRGQGYYILNYPEFFNQYHSHLKYLEVHCNMEIMVQSVLSFKRQDKKQIPLKCKEKDIEVREELPFGEICNITLSKIGKNQRPNKSYTNSLLSTDNKHLLLFKSSNMINGVSRKFTTQHIVRDLMKDHEKNRFIFILWREEGNGFLTPHSFAVLTAHDLCHVNRPYHKMENFTLRQFEPNRNNPMENDLIYLTLSLDKTLLKEEASSSKTSMRSLVTKEFYRSYLAFEIRQNGKLLKDAIRFETDKRYRESIFLKFLQNKGTILPLIIFDRGRRNGVPPSSVNIGLYYLHNTSTTSKANYYYRFIKGFSSAFLRYSKNQHIPVYFFGAVKNTKHIMDYYDSNENADKGTLRNVPNCDDESDGSYDENDSDDSSELGQSQPNSQASSNQMFDVSNVLDTSNTMRYNGGVKPLTLGGSSILGSVEEIMTAYDQNLKRYFPKNEDPPLTPVLRSVLRKHSIPKSIEKGHTIILFLTASDLKDDEDEIEMGNLLQKYRNKPITIIFVRISGPNLPKFYRLRKDNLGIYESDNDNLALDDLTTKQYHFIDIKSFERLIRVLQKHEEIREEGMDKQLANEDDDNGSLEDTDEQLDMTAEHFTFSPGQRKSRKFPDLPSSVTTKESRKFKNSRFSFNPRISLFTKTEDSNWIDILEDMDAMDAMDAEDEDVIKKRKSKHALGVEKIDLNKIELLLIDKWQLISPTKYHSLIGKTYLGALSPNKALKLNDIIYLRDILFADLMEDYLDETFENIITDNVTLALEYQRNKDNIVENDDKQKNCFHAFETFINLFIGKAKESHTLDTFEA